MIHVTRPNGPLKKETDQHQIDMMHSYNIFHDDFLIQNFMWGPLVLPFLVIVVDPSLFLICFKWGVWRTSFKTLFVTTLMQ